MTGKEFMSIIRQNTEADLADILINIRPLDEKTKDVIIEDVGKIIGKVAYEAYKIGRANIVISDIKVN